MSLEPDTKDWTWVLEQPCRDCGFDPERLRPDEVARRIPETTSAFVGALAASDAGRRLTEDRWSVLEYACHVRDVHRIFAERVESMLSQEDPVFANWDQDATAIEQAYHLQDPRTVAVELAEAADRVSAIYARVGPAQWERRGTRSNGSQFTVATIAVYHFHDVVHHVWDVTGAGAITEPPSASGSDASR